MKTLLTLVFNLLIVLGFAQPNTFPSTGNVGVGTINPISDLQVNNGTQKVSIGKVPNQNSQGLGWASNYIGFNISKAVDGWIADNDGAHNGGSMIFGDPFGQFRIISVPSTGAFVQSVTDDQINQNTKFIVNANGNVGIGLGTIPRSPLEVRVTGDNNSVQTGLIIQQTNPGSPNNKAGVSLDFGVGNNSGNNNIEGRITLKETYWSTKPKMFFSLWDESNVMQDRMVIDTYGNVGIGTRNPDTRLAVKGTIHSEEVKVDLNVPAPDYVFENNYNLPSLEELNAYIKVNKHLPEVPSACAMEEYGINLGEMNMLLLKKVEELTLYVIHQNKKILEQNDRLATQQIINKVQSDRIKELENKINK